MKNNKKKKIIGFSILGVIAILITGGIIFYQSLQAEQHFKKTPIFTGEENQQNEEEVELEQPIFNVLLIGSDQRAGETIGHTDSIMIVNVNLVDNEYHILSVPRDSRVYLEGYGYTKLTSVQYILQAEHGSKEGIEGAVEAIADFTGIPIHYYAETNDLGLQAIVDALGGIEMYVPFDVEITHAWYPENQGKFIPEGTHTFDGKLLSDVVRERYSLTNGEFGRQELQKQALIGIAKKGLQPSSLTKLPSLLDSLDEFIIETNMSTTDIMSLALSIKDFDPESQIHYHQLSGESVSMYDDILKANNSQIIIDEEKLEEIANQYFRS